MSVIPVDQPRPASRGGFWQSLAQALDRYFVDRSRRAVPASTVRRSKHDIERCRRLMHKSALASVGPGIGSGSRGRVAQPRR